VLLRKELVSFHSSWQIDWAPPFPSFFCSQRGNNSISFDFLSDLAIYLYNFFRTNSGVLNGCFFFLSLSDNWGDQEVDSPIARYSSLPFSPSVDLLLSYFSCCLFFSNIISVPNRNPPPGTNDGRGTSLPFPSVRHHSLLFFLLSVERSKAENPFFPTKSNFSFFSFPLERL